MPPPPPPPNPYMTTTLTSSSLISLLANRRSYYNLTKTPPTSSTSPPKTSIPPILNSILTTVPSAFNTQSTRLILLLSTSHSTLWSKIIPSILSNHMGAQRYKDSPTPSKLAAFANATGTILFYDDYTDVETNKHKFPRYADHFDGWTEHASGMVQLAVWTALEAEGYGANLQHYNGIIDDEVASEFKVPESWKLKAQLVFGGVADEIRPEEKVRKDPAELLTVFE